MAKKKFPWLPVAIVAGVLMGGGLFASQKWLQPSKPVEYITATVARGEISNTVLANGTITAFHSVDVGAQVSGQILKLAVKLGDRVKQGDLIGEIDPRTAQNNLQNAQASLNSAEAQRAVRAATADKARLDYQRQQSMLKSGATSQESYDNARVSLSIAEAEVKQSEAQIEQAKISVDTAKLNLSYTRIEAPVAGVVVSVPVEVGQTVNANQTTPTIVTIAQLDTVTIKAEISEGDITRVKPGMEASFTILSESERVYRTHLRSIDPGPQSMSDSTSGSSSSSNTSTAVYYYGLLDIDNADGSLRIDMTAQVSIYAQQADDALVVPLMALSDRPRNGIYIVNVLKENGELDPRRVKVGLQNQNVAEVLEGLEEGEQVVISQADGAQVRPQGMGRSPGSGSRTGMPMRL